MTVSYTIILGLLGKTVSFNQSLGDQFFRVRGQIQGICFNDSGTIEFFVNDQTYSMTVFDGLDFQIH